MDKPRALRKYLGDNPAPFMAEINSMSSQCRNMASVMDPECIQSLTRRLSTGTVTVMRVGAMGGVDYGFEFVTVKALGGVSQIILSSAADQTYGIEFLVSSGSVSIRDSYKKIDLLNTTYFSDTYLNPLYDMYVETCPFIYTLDHKNFIIVINGGNTFRIHTNKPRDDWHSNTFTNIPDLSVGQTLLTYYELCTRSHIGLTDIGFSFSPYTATAGLSNISRYIDHAKRLYIPILGRGDEFDLVHPKLKDCESFPYGKKPFTITDAGIITYREVVRPIETITVPESLYFSLQLFWPFIPYLYEIPYLNLQFQSGYPLQASLQNFGSFYAYGMYQNTDDTTQLSTPIRTDFVIGDFPEVSSSSTSTGTTPPPYSGTWTVQSSQSWSPSCSLTKSATIGTIGNLKDILVETSLDTQLAYSYSFLSSLTRSTNFPDDYYSAEWLDDLFWPCCSYTDTTNSSSQETITWATVISGRQRLIVGDLIVEEGIINMSYSGTDASDIVHNGTATRTPTNCPTSIGYTTQQMMVNDTQEFTALDIDNNPASGAEWEVTSGGGTITSAGLYTAPATNANCTSNATISLKSCGVVVDTLQVAISATGFDPNAQMARIWNGAYCTTIGSTYNCAMVGTTYNCIGEISYGPCESGTQSLLSCVDCYDLPINTPSCFSLYGQSINYHLGISPIDLRSADDILNGCCPEQLL